MNWSKVSIWAGILGVPITIAWYLTHFALFMNWLPHGALGALPAALLGLALLCADASLVSLAIGQESLLRRLPAPPADVKTKPDLIPYREWARHWFKENCRAKNHIPQNGPPKLDLTQHEGCSFSGCYMTWTGLICAIEGCQFYGNNQVTVPASDLAKALSFFMREAFVRRDAPLSAGSEG